MGLILEIDEPLLFHAVHFDRHDDAAGVDLIGLFLVLKFALSFQPAHRHERQIHQADKLVLSAGKDLAVVFQVLTVRVLDRLTVVAVVKFYIFQFRGKCCMAAVIRPVRIKHADLCHRRIAVFLAFVIILDMKEVPECHGEAERIIEFLHLILRHVLESVKHGDISRIVKYRDKGVRFPGRRFSGIDRVDAVFLDGLEFRIGNAAFDHIGGRHPDNRRLILIDKTDALLRRIRSLIELSGKIFHGKAAASLIRRESLLIKDINRRLCKHAAACLLKCLIGNILHIITDQHPDACDVHDPEIPSDLMAERFGCNSIIRFLFNVYSFYTAHICSPFHS